MIRSILFIAYMFVYTLLIGIVAFPALFKREWSIAVSKVWAKGLLGGLNVICGIKDRVVGIGNVPQGPALIVANHQSMWETLRLTTLLDRPSFVLKKELENWPIFSWFCKANGFIFIDREAGAKTLRDMTNKAKAMIDEGAQVIIFPEGTRSIPGQRLPFQPGVALLARSLGVPTVPISHDSGRFWVQPGPMKKSGTITLTVHEPITEVADRKTYLEAIEAAITSGETVAHE